MPTLTVIFKARYRALSLAVAGVAALGNTNSDARGPIIAQQLATTARAMHLSETAQLHLVAHQGTQILHEEGQVSGTLRGRLIVVIDIGYTEATVSFTARSSTGTLTGRGVESYYVSGKNGHFSGRTTVTNGTGAYVHASGSNLQTTGLIKRAHYEVLMTVDGQLKS
jgi:hypothetical protein